MNQYLPISLFSIWYHWYSCGDHPRFCSWNPIHDDQAGGQRGAEINGWWLKQEAESGALPKMPIWSSATGVHLLCTPSQCLILRPEKKHSMRMVIQTFVNWSLDPVYKPRLSTCMGGGWLVGAACKSSKYLVQQVLHHQASKQRPSLLSQHHPGESGCDDQTLQCAHTYI